MYSIILITIDIREQSYKRNFNLIICTYPPNKRQFNYNFDILNQINKYNCLVGIPKYYVDFHLNLSRLSASLFL